MQNRRKFVKNILIGAAGISTLSSFDIINIARKEKLVKLTILHTNDMHSRIDPFGPNDKKYANQGGMSKIANLVEKIRNKEANVILLDAGDIFQGTPYFNLFGGEVELKLMSQMKYDAGTMGNHDFDNGIEGFNNVLHNANFPFLCANYDFSETILNGKTKPYHIIEKQGIKIGIFGIGIELDGLVDSRLYGKTIYNDPIESANKYATILKEQHECNAVICLSHLGYEYQHKTLSDKILVKETKNIDLIIKSFKIFNQQYSNSELRIVGVGSELKNLKNLAQKYRIIKNVLFLGQKLRSEIIDEYNSCSAFIYASNFETFGVIFVESMALGRPIISLSCGSSEEIIPEYAGIIVKKKTTEDMSNAMIKLHQDYSKYNPQKIREYCESKFSEEELSLKMIKEYKSVLINKW